MVLTREKKIEYDSKFHLCREIWEQFHIGAGYPWKGKWIKQPKWVLDVVKTFRNEFHAYESEQIKKQRDNNPNVKVNNKGKQNKK